MQTCASLDVRSLCTPGIEQVLLAWLNAEQAGGQGRGHNQLVSERPRRGPGTIHLCKPP